MFNREITKGVKKAAITMEVAIGTAIAIIALFVALGIFSENLKTMITNSGISRMFANNSAKTAIVKQAYDPTSSQVNVQIVGAQGLGYYFAQAQAAIANYKKNPPKNEAEMQDLAKQATIARIGNLNGTEIISGDDLSLFRDPPYGIKIELFRNDTCVTSINNSKKIYYNTDGNDLFDDKSVQLDVIKKEIIGSSFK